jgi:hypothetical protein
MAVHFKEELLAWNSVTIVLITMVSLSLSRLRVFVAATP